MLIGALLVIFFWAVVPGLITGWMLRERGRRFLPGLLFGAVCGPVGILAALAFIYIADRRQARARRPVRGHAVRVFYDVPVVGSLHVSTVWALAGLATFLCLWMIGGIAYEFYRADLNMEPPGQSQNIAAEIPKAKGLLDTNSQVSRQSPAESKLTGQAQSNTSAQTRTALLGNFSTQTGQQPMQGVARSENSSANVPHASSDAGGPVASAPQQQQAAAREQFTPPSIPSEMPNAPPARAPAQARADAVAEVTRDLASRGHRVHAALSGDAQTATLSLSGATLSRAAGNQLLGNGRLRGALKAAGVRIVVLVNGEESWTYIL
jgi:hypothetical protein